MNKILLLKSIFYILAILLTILMIYSIIWMAADIALGVMTLVFVLLCLRVAIVPYNCAITIEAEKESDMMTEKCRRVIDNLKGKEESK